jgi:hypothetical protein
VPEIKAEPLSTAELRDAIRLALLELCRVPDSPEADRVAAVLLGALGSEPIHECRAA